jgi:hypothetical protein
MFLLIWTMVGVSALSVAVDAFIAGELSQGLVEDILIGHGLVGAGLSLIAIVASLISDMRRQSRAATLRRS